jgi:hypothetical protein
MFLRPFLISPVFTGEKRRDGREATMKRQPIEDMKTLELNKSLEHDTTRRHLRERYGKIAESDGAGCGWALKPGG